MRIVAGKYRSRIIKSLKGNALRPTSDRLRETLFNVLGTNVSGSRFLTSSPALARSHRSNQPRRTQVVFIENHAAAATLIRRNLDSLEIQNGAQILLFDALRGLEKIAARHKPTDAPVDFVFRRSALR